MSARPRPAPRPVLSSRDEGELRGGDTRASPDRGRASPPAAPPGISATPGLRARAAPRGARGSFRERVPASGRRKRGALGARLQCLSGASRSGFFLFSLLRGWWFLELGWTRLNKKCLSAGRCPAPRPVSDRGAPPGPRVRTCRASLVCGRRLAPRRRPGTEAPAPARPPGLTGGGAPEEVPPQQPGTPRPGHRADARSVPLVGTRRGVADPVPPAPALQLLRPARRGRVWARRARAPNLARHFQLASEVRKAFCGRYILLIMYPPKEF